MKILLVEDYESESQYYALELKDEGYEVLTAKCGEEAQRLFDKESPDLVTLDIRMPMKEGGDVSNEEGIRLLRYMKSVKKDIPIIMLTAFPFYKYEDFAVWAADAYIEKSSDTTELIDSIKALCSNKGLLSTPSKHLVVQTLQIIMERIINLENRIRALEEGSFSSTAEKDKL